MAIPSLRYSRSFLWFGAAVFILPTLTHLYLLQPFPGSQDIEAFTFSYYLERCVLPMQILGAALLVIPVLGGLARGPLKTRIKMSLLIAICGGVWYLNAINMAAQYMFLEPKSVIFARGESNTITPETIVLGVEANGVAKAYPIRFLAFHHKVHDSLGVQPVLVTYCSMCRSGRVFVPVIDGRVQHFRLVGARLHNAIMEDNETHSWWYQATGDAVIGPRKGTQLTEIESEEMSLKAWTALHPETLIMQPDPASAEGYTMFGFETWDTTRPTQQYFDSVSFTWKPRSWVVGVQAGSNTKAYPWKALVQSRVLNDTLAGVPIVVVAEPDSISFHAWSRDVHGSVLGFVPVDGQTMRDTNTGSTWDWGGLCITGSLKDQKLTPMYAHREFWRSWQTFHPKTSQWE